MENNKSSVVKDINLNSTMNYNVNEQLEDGQIPDFSSQLQRDSSNLLQGNIFSGEENPTPGSMPSHTITSGIDIDNNINSDFMNRGLIPPGNEGHDMNSQGKDLTCQSNFNPTLDTRDSGLTSLPGTEVQDTSNFQHQHPTTGRDFIQSNSLNSIGFRATNTLPSKRFSKSQQQQHSELRTYQNQQPGLASSISPDMVQDIIKGLTPTLELLVANKQLDVELLGETTNRSRSAKRREVQRAKKRTVSPSSLQYVSPDRASSPKRARSDHPYSEVDSPVTSPAHMRRDSNNPEDSDSSNSDNDHDLICWKNCVKLIKNAFPSHFKTTTDYNTETQTENKPLGLQTLGKKSTSSDTTKGLPIGPSVLQNFANINQELANKKNMNDTNFLLRPKRSFTSLKEDEHFYKKSILNGTTKELVPHSMKLSDLASTSYQLPAKHHKLLEESARAPLRHLSHTEWILGTTGKIIAENFPENEDLVNLITTASTMVNKATRDTISNVTNVILI
ncbi:unnamed protein product [Owenia fusiformis]|uniref:Uncharacterized protein n=1 Tax=Owenia fusiformis TaxID=6347 RepID=A0A8J1UEZ0_OWEFU|nr:unnamed protein product [Owenia fusiformis]